jgi:Zn finger protein HypA/HybF involved in hydrogenase expression
MSITRQVTVWCDDCGEWEQRSGPADVLRKELRRKGWLTDFLEDHERKDYCPKCAEKKKQKKG